MSKKTIPQNRKGIRILVFIIVSFLVFLGLDFGKDWYKDYKLKHYQSHVSGEVLEVKPVYQKGTHYSGGDLNIQAYKVEYYYRVKGKTYQNIELIQNNSDNISLIEYLNESKIARVQYVTDQPENSTISNDQSMK